MRHRIRTQPVGILLLLLSGCGEKGPDYPAVNLEGMVTIRGEPVKKGRITFTPQEAGRGAGTGGDIVDGKYKAEHVPVGKVLVQFQATKETGKTVKAAGVDMPESLNIVPPENRGGVHADVAAGDTKKDFALPMLAAPAGS